MKECSEFLCVYSHDSKYTGINICQYSDEPCDMPYLGNCSQLGEGKVNLCNFCKCKELDFCNRWEE